MSTTNINVCNISINNKPINYKTGFFSPLIRIQNYYVALWSTLEGLQTRTWPEVKPASPLSPVDKTFIVLGCHSISNTPECVALWTHGVRHKQMMMGMWRIHTSSWKGLQCRFKDTTKVWWLTHMTRFDKLYWSFRAKDMCQSFLLNFTVLIDITLNLVCCYNADSP